MTNWAKITLDEKNLPNSKEYGDRYFSHTNGLEETKYVFLEGNNLKQRFKGLEENSTFYIMETGFGTGLNFLATLELWQKHAPKSTTLYFHSFEKHPIHPDEFPHMLHFQELQQLYSKLIEIYPNSLKQKPIQMTENVVLQLHLGDIREVIPEINRLKINAFFLDGFSPAKNPDMWCDTVYKNLARLASKDTTLATFTAAGHVRQGLEKAGFNIKKRKGFGYKRHMTIGTLAEQICSQ